jgi:hypothetical protein
MGAFVVIGLPRLIELENLWIVPIGTGILLLVIILRARGGLAGLVFRLRDGLVQSLDEMAQASTTPSSPSSSTTTPT